MYFEFSCAAFQRYVVPVIALVALSGCATNAIPPLNFSVPNVGPSAIKLDAEVKSLTITPARPDEKTGDLPLGIESTLQIWKEAVQEALDRMAIFKDDAPKKVSISIRVLKIDVPAAGLDFTTNTQARYEIIDRETGGIIFTTDISAAGTTPTDFAFLGIARARESVNRSVQNNITQFLQALETVDLNKPMFPTPTAGSPKTAPKQASGGQP